MKSTNVTTEQVILTLTPVEASWLKGVMQNPLWGQTPDEEDSFEKVFRIELFNSLEWV